MAVHVAIANTAAAIGCYMLSNPIVLRFSELLDWVFVILIATS